MYTFLKLLVPRLSQKSTQNKKCFSLRNQRKCRTKSWIWYAKQKKHTCLWQGDSICVGRMYELGVHQAKETAWRITLQSNIRESPNLRNKALTIWRYASQSFAIFWASPQVSFFPFSSSLIVLRQVFFGWISFFQVVSILALVSCFGPFWVCGLAILASGVPSNQNERTRAKEEIGPKA